jgi:hypothetical protein
MKAKDCVVGAEVFTCDGIEYRYIVTTQPDADGLVQVKPANDSSGAADSFDIKELHLYDLEEIKKTAVEYQSKIDAAKDAFQVAFHALQELHNLENKSKVSHYDLHRLKLIDVKELESTIEHGGWSSSSLWC